jgi:nitrile hydratase
VLREMGLDLPATTEIRVWDTTAGTRYMVLLMQPSATIGWPVQELATIVTQDSMIDATRLERHCHISRLRNEFTQVTDVGDLTDA